jgi:spore coat protein CotH
MHPILKDSTLKGSRTFGAFVTTSSLALLIAMLAGCTEPVPAMGTTPAAVPDVFDSAMLHQIEITVETAYMNQLATDLDKRVPSTIVYDGEQVVEAGIRQKGNTAVALDKKPSFSIKFDEFHGKADLHGLQKLVLDNSIQDPTFLRAKLGADIHARAGLAAARVAYAHVTFNGSDSGIYQVVEAIDQDFLQDHFGKANDGGNLYEGPCCGDFVGDIAHMNLEDEVKDSRTRDDLIALAQVILDAPDATFTDDAAKKLDLDAFLKMYALEALLGHWDGFAFRGNNFYMYDNPADSRFVFVPHGMDRILDDAAFDSQQAPAMKLPLRIRAIPALDIRFQGQLVQIAKSAWNQATMQTTIDETVALLHTAGSGAQTTKDIAGLDAKLTDLRNIVTIRSAAIKP